MSYIKTTPVLYFFNVFSFRNHYIILLIFQENLKHQTIFNLHITYR
jgi:hypothetical protein